MRNKSLATVIWFLWLFPPIVSAEVVVEDYSGQRVELEQPARRIVALAPHIVENLYSAGAGDRIVGVVSHSDYPEAATHLPIVGDYSYLNLEKLVELNPDLIIYWAAGSKVDTSGKLKDLGFNVYVDDPRTLDDVARSIRDIGVLAGIPEQSDQVAIQFENQLETLRRQYSHQSTVSVFYQVWHQPLQTLNGEHIISDVIRLCGGRNIYAELETLAPVVDMESLLTRNPQVIFSGGSSEQHGVLHDQWNDWTSLEAVGNQHLFLIPPDLIQRHTVRILHGAERMCERLQWVRDSR